MEVNALLRDAELADALSNAKDSAEIAGLLQSRGLDVSAEEVECVFSSELGELDERELEFVTGGGFLSSIWSYINALRCRGGGGKGSFGGGGFVGGGSR